LNVARIIAIGLSKFNYTEGEIMRMTPRKFFCIYDEYLKINGYKKDDGDEYEVDLMP